MGSQMLKGNISCYGWKVGIGYLCNPKHWHEKVLVLVGESIAKYYNNQSVNFNGLIKKKVISHLPHSLKKVRSLS